MSKKLKVGKDSVVMGNVNGEVGDGSVVIGPTDNQGNTILNQSMAVGRGAKAGPGSIAIGANAGAGSELFHLIDTLKTIPEIQNDTTLLSTIDVFRAELSKPSPESSTVQSLWPIIKASATVGGAISLVTQIGSLLGL